MPQVKIRFLNDSLLNLEILEFLFSFMFESPGLLHFKSHRNTAVGLSLRHRARNTDRLEDLLRFVCGKYIIN